MSDAVTVELSLQDARDVSCACTWRRERFERDLPAIDPIDHSWVRSKIEALDRSIATIEAAIAASAATPDEPWEPF